ncbi:hypothetical protein CKAN_00325000 [Cinnamomum micranthum f. kanehirae]|uniref:Uncharacterized protein n=1 Tax=Cinnamomum micranthum f. kanehirae TaxID=337451 RepID=A0A3S3PXR1_9MAGN|nr:hypothetical protein CKAN_00325000 [Cinnamomum micranthum f. kanehirae]
MQVFMKERELNGDLISKASDALWRRGGFSSVVAETNIVDENSEVLEVTDDDNSGGFLKLTKTQEWVSGDNVAPVNKKLVAKKWQNDREMRKRLNLLKYDAAAISYAAGVLFRLVEAFILPLLYNHSDNLSRQAVPQIFMQKKSKKIGIRSEDLKNLLERTVKGSTVALSSPRLVIPAAIYGVWGLSHHFLDYSFDFQLAPAMFGMFAYKAAALVQVYRDNEDLRFVFPDSEDDANN